MLLSKRYETFQIVGPAGNVQHEFEGATLAGKALPGDEVEALEGGGCVLVKRCEHPALVGILEYSSKIKYGYTSRNIPIYRFTPSDSSYPSFLIGSKEKNTVNHIAVIRFEDWAATTFPRGSLQEILGPCGEESVELKALALQYSPWQWSKKRYPETLVKPDLKAQAWRETITAPTLHIDPPGCRDVDDVLSLWKSENGTWTLAISIADVAELLALNPQLEFAAQIGQTLYQDGEAIRPMFEKKITETVLSLSADDIWRPAVSLFVSWDGKGLSGFRWAETIVKTTHSYTYENCRSYENCSILQEIASHLLGYETSDSHKWIEAVMLLYNTKAAEVLQTHTKGLLRIHSAPEVERLERYKALDLPVNELAYPAATYCSASAPEAPNGHWGLANGSPGGGLNYSVYCHASSPIRRFADCVNQKILKAALRSTVAEISVDSEKFAYHLNRLSKQAKKYERDLFLARKIFEGSTTGPLEGIIVDVGKVYLYDWKRIVNVESAIIPGTEVLVDYYTNMSQRNWKSRILFALVG